VDMKTHFMRPATVGPLFVEAKVVHRGRDILGLEGAWMPAHAPQSDVVHRGHDILGLEGAMKDQADTLIATATATARIYDWPKAPKTK
jgi:acyl-coenzyme A thioesterase PaaI-like protein